MAFGWKKSLILWILGFLAFTAALNTINATIIWSINGTESMVPMYILSYFAPAWTSVPVTTYFLVSISATFILLGLVTLQGLHGPPLGLEVHRMVGRVEDEMVATRGALESTRISLFARMEDEKIARQDMIATLNANIGSVRKEMLDELEKHRIMLYRERKELREAIRELGSFREDVLGTMAQNNKNVLTTENSSMKAAANSERSMIELAGLRKRIEKFEAVLVPPRPKLRSDSRTEEIKGVGSRLAEDLKVIGITNVGELVLSDPNSIGARTRVTPEMASRLQSRARLLMIPCIDEMDAEMLLELGITSKNALVSQDAIELCKRLNAVATAYVAEGKISELERPTIEEVSMWIKSARL